ncbi:hypothetical protein F2Q70_00005169 [Brassica cretica]|uniref:Uncharacterized protein n=1 Tax=Brassica cretica TaxID=69181 RepID=A0A8S9ITC2_BRACR|nr:hypothetical protein F2Q70_00005169 [Brassica cretica]
MIRAQHYGMIGRRRLVVVVLSPASVVDKPGDPALRVVPYGYGLVYVVSALVAGGLPTYPSVRDQAVRSSCIGGGAELSDRSHLFYGAHGRNRWWSSRYAAGSMALRYALMSMECPCWLAREEGLLCVESCLGGCRIGELWLWTSWTPLFRFRDNPSCPSWLPDEWKISIYLKAGEITWPGRRRKVLDSGQGPGTHRHGLGPGGRDPGPRGPNPDPGGRDLEDGSWRLYKLHRIITLPCRSFSDALALGVKGFAAWLEMPELAESLMEKPGTSASVAILGLSSGRALWFHESCGGVYGSVPRNSERENLGEAKDQEDEEVE